MVTLRFSQDLARERRFLARAGWMVGFGYALGVGALYRGPVGLSLDRIALDYLGLLSLLALVLVLPGAAIAARARGAWAWGTLAWVISPFIVRALW